jgi:hypothetical protein
VRLSLSQELAKMKAETQTPEVEGEECINPEVPITEERINPEVPTTEETNKKETRFIKHEPEGEVCEHDEFEVEDMAENTDEANEAGSAKEE